MGDGEQVTDRAESHALLLAVVTLVVVAPALDPPVHVHRRDAVLDDQMLLDRPRRVEEHRLGAKMGPQHPAWLCGLGRVTGGGPPPRGGADGGRAVPGAGG